SRHGRCRGGDADPGRAAMLLSRRSCAALAQSRAATAVSKRICAGAGRLVAARPGEGATADVAQGAVMSPQPDRHHHTGITRRSLLASAALLITTSGAGARVITKVLPWRPNEAYPVKPVISGGYLFFTTGEAAMVDAIVDRLIPTDELGPGARDAGVTTFID